MKNILKRITSIVLVMLISCIWIMSVSAEKKKQIKTLLVLGDSISTGYGLSGYNKDKSAVESYANLVKKDINPESFDNLAIDGQTSTELFNSIKDGKYAYKIKNSDLILITIGGNDLLHELGGILKLIVTDDNGSFHLDVKTKDSIKKAVERISYDKNKEKYDNIINKFNENQKGIVKQIKEINPQARVYFQTIFNPFSGIPFIGELDTLADNLTGKMNEIIKHNTDDNIRCIDVAGQFDKKAYEYTNILKVDIHPNYVGHRVIYNMIMSDLLDKPLNLTNVYEEGIASYTDGKPVMIEVEGADADKSNDSLVGGIIAVTVCAVIIIGGTVLIVLVRNKKISE